MKNSKTLRLILPVAFLFLLVSFRLAENTNQSTKHKSEITLEEDSLVKFLPKAAGVVMDLEDLFTVTEEAKLIKTILKFKAKTTVEIGIISVDRFDPYANIDNYSVALFNKWGIGDAKKNNGVLISVSKSQRIVKITPGTGVRDLLENESSAKIIETQMLPHFKKGEYYKGIYKGLKAIMKIVK